MHFLRLSQILCSSVCWHVWRTTGDANAITFVCAPAIVKRTCFSAAGMSIGWGEGWSSPGPLSYLFSAHSLLVKARMHPGTTDDTPRRDLGSLEGAAPFVNRSRVCLLSLSFTKARDLVHAKQVARPMQSSLFLDLFGPNVLYLSKHAVIRGGGGCSDSEAATKLRDSRHASETFLTVPIGLSGF